MTGLGFLPLVALADPALGAILPQFEGEHDA